MRKNKETREVEWPSGPSIHRSGSRYPWSIDVVCLLELIWSWLIYFSGVCRLTWTGGGTHWSSTATKIRQRRCQNVRCVSLRPPHHMSCNNTVTLRRKEKKKKKRERKKCKYPCNGACKICDRRMWVCLGFGLESRDTRSLFDYLSYVTFVSRRRKH